MTRTADHQMTPEHDTSTPAEDHQSTINGKITEPIRPMHRRSLGDHRLGRCAPSPVILRAALTARPVGGGRRC